MQTDFKLRFPTAEVQRWADHYDYPGEAELIAGPVAAARKCGFLTQDTFMAIGNWKSQRSRGGRASNAPSFVEEVTRIALAPSTSPRLAIEVLTLLTGVSWPTASVVLHFCHAAPYPILDFRALWSLGHDSEPKSYGFTFWQSYTEVTRALAAEVGCDMRTLDRALWKYSEMHQPPRPRAGRG